MTFAILLVAVRAYLLANPYPSQVLTDFAMHQMNGLDLIRLSRDSSAAENPHGQRHGG